MIESIPKIDVLDNEEFWRDHPGKIHRRHYEKLTNFLEFKQFTHILDNFRYCAGSQFSEVTTSQAAPSMMPHEALVLVCYTRKKIRPFTLIADCNTHRLTLGNLYSEDCNACSKKQTSGCLELMVVINSHKFQVII